jgi:hypothetical protein
LIYSLDNGATWRNQAGSTPVVAEQWNARSRKNIVFFDEEPDRAFAWLSSLQMGSGYELNRDGYVYVYSPNGHDDGTMNGLVMFRAHTLRILDRSSYEFFSGLSLDGTASWSNGSSARAVIGFLEDGSTYIIQENLLGLGFQASLTMQPWTST